MTCNFTKLNLLGLLFLSLELVGRSVQATPDNKASYNLYESPYFYLFQNDLENITLKQRPKEDQD